MSVPVITCLSTISDQHASSLTTSTGEFRPKRDGRTWHRSTSAAGLRRHKIKYPLQLSWIQNLICYQCSFCPTLPLASVFVVCLFDNVPHTSTPRLPGLTRLSFPVVPGPGFSCEDSVLVILQPWTQFPS